MTIAGEKLAAETVTIKNESVAMLGKLAMPKESKEEYAFLAKAGSDQLVLEYFADTNTPKIEIAKP